MSRFSRLMLLGAAVSLAASITGQARAEIFTYKAPGFPNGTTSCTEEARQLGARLTDLGVNVLSTACTPGPKAGDLLVQYDASERLAIETNVYHGVLAGIGDYAKRADCEAAVDGERTLFIQNTGLTPFVSYCQFAADDDDQPWLVRVEALGIGTRHIRSQSLLLFGRFTSGADIAEQVRRHLFERGVAVANVRLHWQSMTWYLTPRYYADETIPMEIVEIPMPTRDYCAARLTDVANAFVAAGRIQLGLACSVWASPEASLDIVQISNDGLQSVAALQSWATLAECETALPQVMADYRGTQHGAVTGAVCGIKKVDDSTVAGFSAYLLVK